MDVSVSWARRTVARAEKAYREALANEEEWREKAKKAVLAKQAYSASLMNEQWGKAQLATRVALIEVWHAEAHLADVSPKVSGKSQNKNNQAHQRH